MSRHYAVPSMGLVTKYPHHQHCHPTHHHPRNYDQSCFCAAKLLYLHHLCILNKVLHFSLKGRNKQSRGSYYRMNEQCLWIMAILDCTVSISPSFIKKTAKHIFEYVLQLSAPLMNSITDTVHQLQSISFLALSLAGEAFFFLFNVHS